MVFLRKPACHGVSGSGGLEPPDYILERETEILMPSAQDVVRLVAKI
jgi:hypothetical protein